MTHTTWISQNLPRKENGLNLKHSTHQVRIINTNIFSLRSGSISQYQLTDENVGVTKHVTITGVGALPVGESSPALKTDSPPDDHTHENYSLSNNHEASKFKVEFRFPNIKRASVICSFIDGFPEH